MLAREKVPVALGPQRTDTADVTTSGPPTAEANTMESLKGLFLIASPKLIDRNFFKSVILMVQHNDQGALGLVLNRPLEMTVKAAWEQVTDGPCEIEQPLYQGGPCDGPLMLLHGDRSFSDCPVLDGVYFSTHRDAIQQLVAENRPRVKCFVGYSGWAAGQLESEMEVGGWLTAPGTSDLIFLSEPHALWDAMQRVVSRRGYEGIDPRLIPDDPAMN